MHHRGAANLPACRRGAAFGAERCCGATNTIMRQRGAFSMAEHHRGAVNVHLCHRGAIFKAERHRGAAQTAQRRRGASLVAERHRGAANVYVRHRGVLFRAESHRGAAQTALRGRGDILVTGHHPYSKIVGTNPPHYQNLIGNPPTPPSLFKNFRYQAPSSFKFVRDPPLTIQFCSVTPPPYLNLLGTPPLPIYVVPPEPTPNSLDGPLPIQI